MAGNVNTYDFLADPELTDAINAIDDPDGSPTYLRIRLSVLKLLMGRVLPVEESGTSRMLAAADVGRLVECTNAATTTITVPTGLVEGDVIHVAKGAAGNVQIRPDSGVTEFTPVSPADITTLHGIATIMIGAGGTSYRVEGRLG